MKSTLSKTTIAPRSTAYADPIDYNQQGDQSNLASPRKAARSLAKILTSKTKSKNQKSETHQREIDQRDIHTALQLIAKLREKHTLVKTNICYALVSSNEQPRLRKEMELFEKEVADYLMRRSDGHFPYDSGTGDYKANLQAVERVCEGFTVWFNRFAGAVKASVQVDTVDTKDVDAPVAAPEIPTIELIPPELDAPENIAQVQPTAEIIDDDLAIAMS